MAKKKKQKKSNKKNKKNEKKHDGLQLGRETKKGIASVTLFLLAILFTFGFFDAGGALGGFLNKSGGTVFGWGKWLFPVVLTIAGIILLYRKRPVFYYVKIIGLIIVFIGSLGVFHIFYNESNMLTIAKSGQGGGFIGYAIAIGLVKFTGKAGSIIVLLGLMAIGLMITFNFSVLRFFAKLVDLKSKNDTKEDEGNIFEKNIKEKKKKRFVLGKTKKLNKNIEQNRKKKKKDIDDNIKDVRFVEGPIEDNEVSFEAKENGQLTTKRVKSAGVKASADFNVMSKESVGDWKLPPLNILEKTKGDVYSGNIEENISIIEDTFANFNIELERGSVQVGPTVTQYSFRPAVGIKLSKIVALRDDLALALAEHPIRIEAPIPGKSLIGIEVPNKSSARVGLREILESESFANSDSSLDIALGKDVEGKCLVASLGKMPHLLVAGATGTGKSVCINSILLSLLYRNSPDNLKLILVDPKRVELSLYNKIPHLLSEVITDNKRVVNALRWAVKEMEDRYMILESIGSRDIESYKIKQLQGVKRRVEDPDTGEIKEDELKKMPYIVIVIDEMSELMAAYGKEVEGLITRLAQLSRAVGIHLIISTQRPSVAVITGLIKANISTRIALKVPTQIDSRTIIDMRGAEDLLGKGDMLFLSGVSPKPKRIQVPFVSENEVKKTVKFIRKQAEQLAKKSVKDNDNRIEDITVAKKTSTIFKNENNFSDDDSKIDFSQSNNYEEDSLYEEVKSFVIQAKKASASLIQRRFRMGFNRAARLLDDLENRGVVGPADGNKQREILVSGDENNISSKKDTEYNDDQLDQEKRDKWQM